MLTVKAAVNAEHTLEGFRGHVEHAFDDAMERASGWYKRKVQLVLLVLSVAVAIGLNVDSVRVATSFWNDQALRSAVVAKDKDPVKTIEGLQLPVGWGSNTPDNVLAAVPGWLLTIAALQLGAPFWFDLLSRLARLRGSGVPERPRSLNDTAGTVENDRVVRRDRASARVRGVVKEGRKPPADPPEPEPPG
jgi:hypothetical protein